MSQLISEYKNLDYDTRGTADPVVINTWYTALDTIYNAEAWYLVAEQTNNGATAEDIELELTVNGTIYVSAGTRVSGTLYYSYFTAEGVLASTTAIVRQLMILDSDQSAPLETKSLKIRVRQTSAVDAVSAVIEVNMVYAQKEWI